MAEDEVTDTRVPTGIPGLDRMLGGGLRPGRPYLVTGGTGSGKTLLGLTFLLEGIRRGEEVLLVAVDEPPSEIVENVNSLGWDLMAVKTLDANPGHRDPGNPAQAAAADGGRPVPAGAGRLDHVDPSVRREVLGRPSSGAHGDPIPPTVPFGVGGHDAHHRDAERPRDPHARGGAHPRGDPAHPQMGRGPLDPADQDRPDARVRP